MKTLNPIVFYVAIITILSSCYSHTYNTNNNYNVPLLKNKKDVFAAISMGTNGNGVESINFNGAYALTKEIGIAANYMFSKNEDYPEFGQKGHYYDGAIGYFKSFGNLGNFQKPFIFDVYLGVGTDNQHHLYKRYYSEKKEISNISYYKPFIQSSVGACFNGLDFAVSGRMAYLSFNNFDIKDIRNIHETYKIEKIMKQKNFLTYGFAFTTRIGWKYVKLQNQISVAYHNHPEIMSYNAAVHVGLVFSFRDLYKK